MTEGDGAGEAVAGCSGFEAAAGLATGAGLAVGSGEAGGADASVGGQVAVAEAARIDGWVFIDSNLNHRSDAGEGHAQPVIVELEDGRGAVRRIRSGAGEVTFPQLFPGRYAIRAAAGDGRGRDPSDSAWVTLLFGETQQMWSAGRPARRHRLRAGDGRL